MATMELPERSGLRLDGPSSYPGAEERLPRWRELDGRQVGGGVTVTGGKEGKAGARLRRSIGWRQPRAELFAKGVYRVGEGGGRIGRVGRVEQVGQELQQQHRVQGGKNLKAWCPH